MLSSAGNGVRQAIALTIFMHIVRAFPCLTPFPTEFITIMPVGLRPPGGPGGQKIGYFWDGPGWSQTLGGVRGSFLSNFDGFSKDFEKLNFQKLKIN